ncbi:porin family protein [Flavobacteriaceae bacterium GSB9]|nr:porin family protein [Flavobacteriaceae bacterium GSB9]
MKQNLLLVFLLIFTIKSFSQDSKFSLELNYPIPIDNNFIGENYNGIIDFGANYRFTNLNHVNIGISFNGGILVNNSSQNSRFQDFKVTSYVIQPRIYGELDLESIKKFHPSIGIGYTIMVFDANGTNDIIDGSDLNDTQSDSGFNFNFGIAYDITEKLFTQVQYDFIKLTADSDVPDIKFNTNVNILKIGLGYRL